MNGQNVIVLCSDEHARSAMGASGHGVVKTPTLDRLAARGTRFERAYSPSPICVPARASLATGSHVFEHRCWSSAEPYHGQVESWMHRLRDAGHAVVSVGKLHFRSADDDNGFAEEIAPMHVANEGRGWLHGLLRDPLPEYPEAAELATTLGPGDSAYADYDREIAAEACRWLRRYPKRIKDRPWVLFVSFVSPHYPLLAPQPFFDLYTDSAIPDPIDGLEERRPDHPVLDQMARFWNYDEYFDPETRRLARRSYYGLCSFLDDNIRQVLEALEESGGARNTDVLYVSDHGDMLGDHGFWTKSVMYEGAVGVPMILTGSDVPVGVNQTPVSLIDVAATIERSVKLDRPSTVEPWQGRPLQGFIAAPEPDRFVLSEYHDGGSPTGFFMIRHGAWKYVHYVGDHPDQLFDLESDPMEQHDLGEDRRLEGTRERLHGLLCRMLDPDAVNAEAFADQSKRLASLGGRDKVLALPSFNHTPVG